MSVFALAVDVLFEDPNLALDALWRAGGAGAGVAARVMRRAPDDTVPWREARLVVDTVFFDLRVAEAPALAAGDTLEVEGVIYLVQGEPTRDAERLIWTVGARET